MKILAIVSLGIALAGSGIFLFPQQKENLIETVYVQKNLSPIHIVTGSKISWHGESKIVWANDLNKTNKTEKSISFVANTITIEQLLLKLNSNTEKFAKVKDGKKMAAKWLVEKNKSSTFLKLIYPSEIVVHPREKGC